MVEFGTEGVLAGSLTVSTVKDVVWSATKTCAVTVVGETVGVLDRLVGVLPWNVHFYRDTRAVHQLITSVTRCALSCVNVPSLAQVTHCSALPVLIEVSSANTCDTVPCLLVKNRAKRVRKSVCL